MERVWNASPMPGSIAFLAQGMLSPSTDNGVSKMPPTVRRDKIITHIGKMRVKFIVLF
jgi:hypothetical protein